MVVIPTERSAQINNRKYPHSSSANTSLLRSPHYLPLDLFRYTYLKMYRTLVLLLLSLLCVSQAAVMHSHSHSLNKEREEDGAFSPKDKHHRTGSGEHHSEFDHEAILGSYKEAEEFDQLSPEESKKRLGILLLKMDLNGDKHVDRKELKAWILRSFK